MDRNKFSPEITSWLFPFACYPIQTTALILDRLSPNPLKTAHHQISVKRCNCHLYHGERNIGRQQWRYEPFTLLTSHMTSSKANLNCSYPRSGEEMVLPLMLKGKEIAISALRLGSIYSTKKVFFTVASWEAQRNACPKSLAGAAHYRLPSIMVPLRLAVSLQFLISTLFSLGEDTFMASKLGSPHLVASTLSWWAISPVPTFSFSPTPNTLNLDLDESSKFTIIKDAQKHPRQQYHPTCLSTGPPAHSHRVPNAFLRMNFFSDVMFWLFPVARVF